MRSASDRPIVGIVPDVIEPQPNSVRAASPVRYAHAVREAGGMPVVLPPVIEEIGAHVALCRAFVLTGGDDPRTEVFGEPTHPKAKPVNAVRQEYEIGLIKALSERPRTPVLGICLGMQMMALVAGGRLNQHMPDDVPTHLEHWEDARHVIRPAPGSPLAGGVVTSHHRQAVVDAGSLRVIATSEDGVVEAIDDPARPFYLGVQWHPERTEDPNLGRRLFDALVRAAREG